MAIRITRVYTKTGDRGETGLVGGKRVPKDSPRIEAYGSIDEMNAAVGLARAFGRRHTRQKKAARTLDRILTPLQNRLFDIGSELATPPDAKREGMFKIGEAEIRKIERQIDAVNADLHDLQSFVLPGGEPVGGFLYLACTICRRAERNILRLSRKEKVSDQLLKYVNRMSDLLFVLARWAGNQFGEEELLWERGLRSKRKRRPKKS